MTAEMENDLARERYRRGEVRPSPHRSPAGGTAAMVGRVTTANASIGVGKFLMVHPVDVFGAETEGSAGTLTPGSASVPVFLVGPGLAATGDDLVCYFVDDRWAAERATGSSGGPVHQMPGCPCANIPDVIYMHVARQPTNGLESLVFPATLQWQPKPALIAGYGTDPVGYYSTTTFVSSAGSYKFYYWFTCSQGTYVVRGLITPDSPNGFPGQFLIMTWLPGFPGNTCTPFSLHNGSSLNQAYQLQGINIDGTGPP